MKKFGKMKKISVCMLIGMLACGCANSNPSADGQNTNKSQTNDTMGTSSSLARTKDDDQKSSSKTNGKNESEPFDSSRVSDEYLVGYDYFTGDFLEYAPVVVAKVRYDKRLEVSFERTLFNGEHYEDVVYFDLSDEQYKNIEEAIDLEKLYTLDPEEQDPNEVCDGGSCYLMIYDKNGGLYKSCGGFCPVNKEFNQMRNVVHDNLPEDFKKYCKHYKDVWVRGKNFDPYHGKPGQSTWVTTYGVFLDYEGELGELYDYDYLVIDAQNFEEAEIQNACGYRKYIYSYLNIGSLEDFREYYNEYADLTLGDYENWEGEKWVDVSDKRWQDFILNELAPQLLEKGISGFFVDNCDVYYQYPTEETLEGLATIMRGLRQMGCEVIINGGDAFLDAYCEKMGKWQDVITGINQECVFTAINFEDDSYMAASEEDQKYFTDYIEKYADQGAYIYLIEYAPEIPANRPLRYNIKYYSEEHKFLYYIADSFKLKKESDQYSEQYGEPDVQE